MHLPYLLNVRLLFLGKNWNLTNNTIKYSLGFECFLNWKNCENCNCQNYSIYYTFTIFIKYKATVFKNNWKLFDKSIKYSIGFMTHNFECFFFFTLKKLWNYNCQNYSKGRCLILYILWKLTILATSTALQLILLLNLSPSSFKLPKQFWARK